ncbi:excinuclease ABC subunit UvrA [Patescibacteria group bacterium]|nr:excinuclease ABC subunit UvrA [Patescibacteria group bacterium]
MMKEYIDVKGARQHNLKNINVKIPKNKLVVFTGISGSGKSSLAFDTVYAEGQRRYVESLSAYARQFLGIMDKPDVETIKGLSPAISIDQKATSHNPRSTVGTITEIYDYLRLLFARIGHPHCPECRREIAKQSPQQITEAILDHIVSKAEQKQQARVMILAPVVRDRKGEFTALFDNLRSQGYGRVRIDGRIFELDEDFVLIKTNKHTIDVVLDRLSFSARDAKDKVAVANLKSRLATVVEQGLELSDGLMIAADVKDKGFDFPEKPKLFEDHLYSEKFACPQCNLSLPEIEPRTFSFNSPHGACPQCNGIGSLLKVAPELVVNPEFSIAQGAILPFAHMTAKDTWFARTLKTILTDYNESPETPWKNLPASLKDLLLFGDDSRVFTVFGTNRHGRTTSFDTTFDGLINNLNRRYSETDSEIVRSEIEKFMRKETCPACQGKRLKKEALSITIQDRNIIQVTNIQIKNTADWIDSVSEILTEREAIIAAPILKETQTRLKFLTSVGLSYLTLNREAATLAGGEAQRIRLASQIGTGLSGVLYVLDEPTIGLHQHDNKRLISTLKNLRDLGNTVLIVEHDRETMESADWIIDFGPGAGKHGGSIVAAGTPAAIKSERKSLTGQYLSGKKRIAITKSDKDTNQRNDLLILEGCRQHNLKDITVRFPLDKLICICGVSGSGKSTLVHDILYHALMRELNFLYRESPGEFDTIRGVGDITRVSLIDQSPIGRTPRSNPATYTKAFDYIRKLFASTREAAIRGYKPGRFSFNVRGGRCEACQGGGQERVEMQFLPDVYVTCEVCKGSRYNTETLQIHYRGKPIDNVLHMTVDEAVEFFKNIPGLSRKLETLQDVGLGYIELGQPAPTLSGGEAQRIKIARELSVRGTGHTIYILDEPTTGLHFADLQKLLNVLRRLVDAGNTVIIIEHNLDVIKNADWVIDLGPEGGDEGGKIVATGTPEEIAKAKDSYTGHFLKEILV